VFDQRSGFFLYFAFVTALLGGEAVIAQQLMRRSLQTMMFAEQPATESRVVVGLAAQDRAAIWQPVANDVGPFPPPPPPSLAILARQLDEAEQHVPITKPKRSSIALSRGPRVAGWIVRRSSQQAHTDPESTAEIIVRSLKAEL
jgi:hypothetical protein